MPKQRKPPNRRAPDKAHAALPDQRVRLGKMEPKEDERNLRLAAYLVEDELPAEVPTHVRHTKSVKRAKREFPMYANDRYGDCTCASLGHATMVWSFGSGRDDEPTEDEVLALYWATGATDDGRYMLDVLNAMRHVGLGDNKVEAFVQVDHTDRREVELATWLFGGVYAGLWLPVSAQAQVDRWHVVRGDSGEPGSWGGHAVWVPDYTKMRGPTCVTWGQRMSMTWGFWRKYADEAYAVLSPDWFDVAEGKSPDGFDVGKLAKDLAAVGR